MVRGNQFGSGAFCYCTQYFPIQNQKSKTLTPTDPGSLPFGTPSGKVRPPIKTEQGFKTGLFKAKPVHLAANGSLSGITLPGTALPSQPNAVDLAEIEDIALTPGDPGAGSYLLRI